MMMCNTRIPRNGVLVVETHQRTEDGLDCHLVVSPQGWRMPVAGLIDVRLASCLWQMTSMSMHFCLCFVPQAVSKESRVSVRALSEYR